MKEYRLVAWAELPAPYHRMAYRRILTDLSHRYMTVPQLAACSGLRRTEVRQFLDMLDSRDLLVDRDLFASDSVFDSLRPLGGWIRKALHTTSADEH
ncbi:MAG: hypothetical protein KF891_00865 [Rhizobacter sp.]|nr:hypothetical protein [Rhizobacter sp.]